MNSFYTRTELVYGDKVEKFKKSTVMVVGVGGVGSYAAEALARTGIGRIILVDKDEIDVTNINRQLHALHSTVGRQKVDVMEERLTDINPDIQIDIVNKFELDEAFELIPECDFVIDAIDTITNKILLIKECLKHKTKFISSMGAANKVDPTKFEIADIRKTQYDPIARVIRQKVKKENIRGKIPVVFSKETPRKQEKKLTESSIRKVSTPPGSIAFVPSTVGLICASYVINTLATE